MEECCSKESNLSINDAPEGIVVKICGVCGRRHFEVELDKGEILGNLNG